MPLKITVNCAALDRVAGLLKRVGEAADKIGDAAEIDVARAVQAVENLRQILGPDADAPIVHGYPRRVVDPLQAPSYGSFRRRHLAPVPQQIAHTLFHPPGAGAVNHRFDRDTDPPMSRTASPPVAAGRVSPPAGRPFRPPPARGIRPAR